MSNIESIRRLRVLAATAGIGLAMIRVFVDQSFADRMDTVFFIVLAAAAALLILPIERAKQLKAGDVELTLDLPQVEGAIHGLALGNIQSRRLRSALEKLQDDLKAAQGSRVLWIDDFPLKLTGERRLLRALGINVISATSSEAAEHILASDNDFDALVTDVQREGRTHLLTAGVPFHEGTNFVVKFKTTWDDPIAKAIPVVFYAAYDPERLVEYTQPARNVAADVDISNEPVDFISKLVRRLSEARSRPIVTPAAKIPT